MHVTTIITKNSALTIIRGFQGKKLCSTLSSRDYYEIKYKAIYIFKNNVEIKSLNQEINLCKPNLMKYSPGDLNSLESSCELRSMPMFIIN